MHSSDAQLRTASDDTAHDSPGGSPDGTGAQQTAQAATEAAEQPARKPEKRPGTMLTRAQAARRLGVSVSTIRRMEGDDLQPVLIAGTHDFHSQHVERMASSSGGELAARVFDAFERGSHPVDLVIELKLPPERIEALHATYCRMRQAIVVQAPAPQSTKMWMRLFKVNKLDGYRVAGALQIVASHPDPRRRWLGGPQAVAEADDD